MKIEGGIKALQALTNTANRSRIEVPGAANKAGGETVEFSLMSSALAQAEARIAATPTVDRARVDEIRAAISEGRFQMDAGRIADGLINSVREMLESQQVQ